ncbi:hypothetical protein SSAG_02642 [Streptomyces sp. Mg1]|nr:hypothetical protein SSAG_02642 [Streptomyces sp. Mg1]
MVTAVIDAPARLTCTVTTARAEVARQGLSEHVRCRNLRASSLGVVSGPQSRKARGVIPACAGSRSRPCEGRPSPGGHPRVRGEQIRERAMALTAAGSSPRARGADTRAGDGLDRGGVIPACAGSSVILSPGWRSARGSSPRARGAGIGPRKAPQPDGVIPACAGSSLIDLPLYASCALF